MLTQLVYVDEMAIFTVSGRIDFADAPIFDAMLGSALDAETLILDLTDVTYLNSQAVRGIAATQVALNRASKDLILVGLDAPIQRLFEVVGLTIPQTPTLQAALAA